MSTNWTVATLLTPAAILTAVAVAYGAVSKPDDMRAATFDAPEIHSPGERFADAPHGVDPIVTGPAPKAFRDQQRALDCDTARWPDIPAGCYPDMKSMN